MLREIDPHDCMTADSLAPVLLEVNKIRAIHSQPALTRLPSGIPQEEHCCPMYYAFQDCWPSNMIRIQPEFVGISGPFDDTEEVFELPDLITDFINLFDMIDPSSIEAQDND